MSGDAHTRGDILLILKPLWLGPGTVDRPFLDPDIGVDLLRNVVDRVANTSNITSDLVVDRLGWLWLTVATPEQAKRAVNKLTAAKTIFNNKVACQAFQSSRAAWPPGFPVGVLVLSVEKLQIRPVAHLVGHNPKHGGIRHKRNYFGAVKVVWILQALLIESCLLAGACLGLDWHPALVGRIPIADEELGTLIVGLLALTRFV